MRNDMMIPPNVQTLIEIALEEDLGRGDVTGSLFPADQEISANIIAKQNLVFAGGFLVPAIIRTAHAHVVCEIRKFEGDFASNQDKLVTLQGSARDILAIERTILNFLQRLSGVATQSRAIKEKLQGSATKIVDTRKTLPGWRYLDKYAVKTGGLENHRFGLDSGILIKENHIAAAGGIAKAIAGLRGPHGLKVQVEVESRAEAIEAAQAGAEMLLLDNFASDSLVEVIEELRATFPHLILEVSGGVTFATIPEYLKSKPDYISMGALTHSVQSVDLSLLVE